MARTASKTTNSQNRRHRARTAARHTGRRQIPGLHEHIAMMYPFVSHAAEDPAEEAQETSQQEAAEEAAGTS